MVDDSRPGQANTVITADLIDEVDDFLKSYSHVTLQMLAAKVDVGVETVWATVSSNSLARNRN